MKLEAGRDPSFLKTKFRKTYAVDISKNGNVYVAGAPGALNSTGVVRAFEQKDGASWESVGQNIYSKDSPGVRFGHSVSLDFNGEHLVVGAPAYTSDGQGICTSTDGWNDQFSYGCEEYTAQGWCDGTATVNSIYAGYGAEIHCCECGGGTYTGVGGAFVFTFNSEIQFCSENFHVHNHECEPCPYGEFNDAGHNPLEAGKVHTFSLSLLTAQTSTLTFNSRYILHNTVLHSEL